MKKLKKLLLHIGLGLTYTGVLLLAAGYFAGWLNSNWFLTLCFVLILSGVILHVIKLKSESIY